MAGDWQARLASKVHSLGCDSVADFLANHPAEPYVKLVRRLGADVAAVQLMWAAFADAKARNRLRDAALDGLARDLSENVKRGWGRGQHFTRMMARAYAHWITNVEQADPGARPLAESVWQALESLPPPEGWIPLGPNDPILSAAFLAGWPVDLPS